MTAGTLTKRLAKIPGAVVTTEETRGRVSGRLLYTDVKATRNGVRFEAQFSDGLAPAVSVYTRKGVRYGGGYYSSPTEALADFADLSDDTKVSP